MDIPAQGGKQPAEAPSGTLKAAIRKARIEQAERSDVITDLRGAENTRLELLQEAVNLVLDEVPRDVDLFDSGLVPGPRPRLFIDMLAFVEMARDRRTYRFLLDTRHGRVTILESDQLGAMVEAITNYIARRLIEREQALASDQTQLTLRTAPVSIQGTTPAETKASPPSEPVQPPQTPEARAPIHIRRPARPVTQAYPPQTGAGAVLRGLLNSLTLLLLILLVSGAFYFAAQEWLHRGN